MKNFAWVAQLDTHSIRYFRRYRVTLSFCISRCLQCVQYKACLKRRRLKTAEWTVRLSEDMRSCIYCAYLIVVLQMAFKRQTNDEIVYYSKMTATPQQVSQLKSLDLGLLKQLLAGQARLPRQWAKQLISDFIKVVKEEPNVIRINDPVYVVGDIHGQFYDLLKILSLLPSTDAEPKEHLLFLGDYVDRGPQGVQVVLLLMMLKLKYPRKVIMLRGNHESRQITQIMNFYHEACEKFDQDVYFDIMDAFDALPLVCIVNDSYFCVHAGITREGESLAELQKLKRHDEIPLNGSICDLTWSDPVHNEQGDMPNGKKWMANDTRNCSIFYGREHCREFMKREKLITIVRAHQVQQEGYKHHMWPKWNNVPMVYTVFSAPNYCGNYGNFGAVLIIEKSEFRVRQFKDSNPKYYVPSKYNAFTFTLPKVFDSIDKVLRRIAKRAITLFPELNHTPVDQSIGIYLASSHCKSRLAHAGGGNVGVGKGEGVGEEFGEGESAFSRSQIYYKESEKRPEEMESVIMSGEKE